MKDMVEIEVVLDERYSDPKVTIQTKAATKQVENIIYAIENASNNDYPQIVANTDDRLVFISQRDIVRVFTEGRRVIVQTDEESFISKRSLVALEEDLNPGRFVRISQSEVVNLYKVKCFDLNTSGTIGVEFDCGIKTWCARSRVKDIKNILLDNTIKTPPIESRAETR